ncbi:hypothetical protein I3842_15G106500 [Carya illinoinensis]|uniref:TIR domain-containing protein n=1 Tax=Carya illinoinensis TaxID=32201 RepID=A0A922D6X4_CARIL|nr:hypothetical protein I3842_15G106500 [Carya illinoinensis]
MALQGASSSLRSSSSSVRPWTHEVFLSFKGEDVRQKFISHLHRALNERGINTCIDDKLKRGEEISQTLFQVIKGSLISIIVLSKNYAESKWLKEIVLPIFYEVDPSDVRHQKGSFGKAFAKLKDRFEGNEKVLKWKAALKELANMSGKELEFIEEIIQLVNSRIVNQTHLNVANYPVGIECRKRDIYQHLSIERKDIIHIVGIFGIGGIGMNVIKHRLCSKRVLLILDDVDELVQIEKLVGDRDWFGLESRIIVTTRDQQLLKIFEVDPKYELKLLYEDEALRLFSLHAFKKEEPLDGYVELSKQVIKYAQGLPLALTVLGSDLKGKSRPQWKSALEKYKSWDFSSTVAPTVLHITFIKKDMGRGIVQLKSPLEPSERSRLWFHNDICGVLEEGTGTNKVAGMIIEMPKGKDVIRLSHKAFERMKNLRVLIIRNASFSSGPNYLSNELRVLDWIEYPLQSLPPNFHGNKLIIFKMRDSFIRELSFIKFKNMTIMEFCNCNFLTKFLDVSSIQNLKKLMAINCKNLVEVHNSIGSLENLCHLSFWGCSNFHSFPEIGCEMKSLTTLSLTQTTVEELSLSISNLTRLEELQLTWCKNLKPIEEQISSKEEQLPELAPPTNSSNGSSALQVLNHQNCLQSESNSFPISCFFNMFYSSDRLTQLDLSESKIVSLPTSIRGFVALKRALLVGHYNAAMFLENEIPKWLQYHKEFLENEIAERGADDVQLKGNEEWVINIERPHHLEEISGIAIYLVTFFNEDLRHDNFDPDVEITVSAQIVYAILIVKNVYFSLMNFQLLLILMNRIMTKA